MHPSSQSADLDGAYHLATGVSNSGGNLIGGMLQLDAKRRGTDLAILAARQKLLPGTMTPWPISALACND